MAIISLEPEVGQILCTVIIIYCTNVNMYSLNCYTVKVCRVDVMMLPGIQDLNAAIFYRQQYGWQKYLHKLIYRCIIALLKTTV